VIPIEEPEGRGPVLFLQALYLETNQKLRKPPRVGGFLSIKVTMYTKCKNT
jgi:hypothetical protein